MSDEKKPGAIYALIAKVMDEVGAIGKNRANEAQRYRFRGIDDVYNALHPAMVKHGVVCEPYVEDHKSETYKTAKGSEMYRVIVTMRVRFMAPDGSAIEARAVGEGSDSGDKATNKAMAAAMKYACLMTFVIPTEEQKDSEYDNPEPRAPRQAPPPQMPLGAGGPPSGYRNPPPGRAPRRG